MKTRAPAVPEPAGVRPNGEPWSLALDDASSWRADDGFAMHVYRAGSRLMRGDVVHGELVHAVHDLLHAPGASTEATRRAVLHTLVDAGALEAAFADAGHPATDDVAAVTDLLAAMALDRDASPPPGGRADGEASAVLARLARVVPPAEITVSTPEGFTYYALHPEAYAQAMAQLDVASRHAVVVGVRSIGTTLSAIATVALRARGVHARRLTVRPTGAPYDRRLELTGRARGVLAAAAARAADVVIVDEGPGISGSTFLATAEAMTAAGVSAERVTLVASHAPDLDALTAPEGAARWRRYRLLVAPGDVRLPPASADLSAGAWRSLSFGHGAAWPASFISTERRKLLSPDGRLLFKFEGLGRAGADVLARGHALAAAGFAPRPDDAADGFTAYPWLTARGARPLTVADVTPQALARMAAYCAARPDLAPAHAAACDLRPMVEKNLAVAGLARSPNTELDLPTPRLAIVDGRMLLHEWVRERKTGEIWKVDGSTHGDDHFFPGPTDIAWDLAGVIVECELGDAARDLFLDAYRRASGDDARDRLRPWMLAYVAFRLGFTALALASLRCTDEAPRLARDLARYRMLARGLVDGGGLNRSGPGSSPT